jgi:hypothetical protein
MLFFHRQIDLFILYSRASTFLDLGQSNNQLWNVREGPALPPSQVSRHDQDQVRQNRQNNELLSRRILNGHTENMIDKQNPCPTRMTEERPAGHSLSGLVKARSVRHGSGYDIEVNDYSYAREVKYQYMSFRERFLVEDHEISYSARRFNFIHRTKHLGVLSVESEFGKYHSLSSVEEQEMMFQQFIQRSKDLSVLWDHVRRLPVDRVPPPHRVESSSPDRVTSMRGLSLAHSFTRAPGSRRLKSEDETPEPRNAKAKPEPLRVSTLKKSSKQLSSPKSSPSHDGFLGHTFSSSQLLLPPDPSAPFYQHPLKSLFQPMPFSHLEIIRQAQHPTKAIVGGRTVINKFLNQIFDSMTASDWVLPFVVTILLLFHAEDHKLRDMSHIFHRSTPVGSLCRMSSNLTEALGDSFAAASSSESNRKESFSSSDHSWQSSPTTNAIVELEEKVPPSRAMPHAEMGPSSVPIFPIASSFPSYRFLSTVFVTQQSPGSIFWIQTQLFLIDGFLFQCDLDGQKPVTEVASGRGGQKYLIPTGFIFLDEGSVQLVEKEILVRGECLVSLLLSLSLYKSHLSLSPCPCGSRIDFEEQIRGGWFHFSESVAVHNAPVRL